METKKWYESKTIWFNVLALVVIIANAFGFVGFAPTEDVTELAGTAVVVINLILRFITNQGIRLQ